jgi:NADH-quinone oxidoreductase subunit L
VGGFINIPHVFGGHENLHHYLEPVFANASAHIPELSLDHTTEYMLMGISVIGVLIAMFIAYNKYVNRAQLPVAEGTEKGVSKLSYHKFYIDELYDTLFKKPLDVLSGFFYKVIDVSGIDGIVNGFGKAVMQGSKNLRLLQTGYTGFYIFAMVAGIILILLLNFFAK